MSSDVPDFADRRGVLALAASGGLLMSSTSAATGGLKNDLDPIRLSAMGAHARTFADETSIVQDAIDLAIASRRPLVIDVATRVSSLRVRNANGLLVFQAAPIVGLPQGEHGSLLSIEDSTDIAWTGRLWLSAQWNTGYAAAVHIHTEKAGITGNITIHDWSISGARTAFRFGSSQKPTSAVSEITILGGHSYGCPNVVEAYGTETLVSFVGANLVANHLGGKADWARLASETIRVIGASISVTGGEVQHNASEHGSAFLMMPCVLPDGSSRYGSIIAMGAAIEAAGPLLTITDLPGARVDPDSGHFFIEGCHGYHSQRSFPFIVSGEQYSGRIKIGSGCFFRAGAQRTSPIVRKDGQARLDIPDDVFNRLFHP